MGWVSELELFDLSDCLIYPTLIAMNNKHELEIEEVEEEEQVRNYTSKCLCVGWGKGVGWRGGGA